MAALKLVLTFCKLPGEKPVDPLPCKVLLLLAIGRGQSKGKYPVMQTLGLYIGQTDTGYVVGTKLTEATI